MIRTDLTQLLLDVWSTNLLDWLVPPPLLGEVISVDSVVWGTEGSMGLGTASWWLVPVLLGWSGLLGWQESRRREALKRVQELEQQLADATAQAAELGEKLQQREDCIMHLSHELRNPLNQVIGEAELALQENGRRKAELQPVLRALRRLAARFDNIERYYSLIDGQWVSFPETVDVETWLRTQANSLDCSELMARVEFSVSIENPEQIYMAEFNAGDLRTVLRHLVSNAIRFTSRGRIEVKMRISSQTIDVVVSDTGCGFDSSRVGQGDLVFFQADRSRTKHQQGLGMGLAICRELARQVGGRLEIHAEPDRGTKATFSLPLRVVEGHRSLRQPLDDMALPWILVVDDDPANQEFMAEVCRRNNWQVDVAWNGLEAVRRVQRKFYDVILMDGAMPKMDGFEATRQIRQLQAQEPLQSTIVATTGLTSPQDQQQFWAAGVNNFVTKPVEPRELVALIRMHLGV